MRTKKNWNPDPDQIELDTLRSQTPRYIWRDSDWLDAVKHLKGEGGIYSLARLQEMIRLAPKLLTLTKLDPSLRRTVETFQHFYFTWKASQ